MTKLGEEMVNEEGRDKLFSQIKTINDNNICLDCEKKNPKWTSIHLGIHLCLDCAGKHRQYGVIYSFVKSTNLDAWNRKQLLFMEKGGNSRALQYFRKRGVITPHNKHIDYKSPVVQQYKAILTEEVEMELGGVKPKISEDKKVSSNKSIEAQKQQEKKKIEIPVAQQVQAVPEKSKKKKDKKGIKAKQIQIDFQGLAVDNGVPTEQKDKIIKQYEKKKDVFESAQNSEVPVIESESSEPQLPKIEEPKELSEEEAKKKIEELKQKSNDGKAISSLSSDDFKDKTVDNVTLKQNLNKFQGSSSISSSAFFNKPEESGSGETMENVKGFLSNAVGKLSGLSSYFNK